MTEQDFRHIRSNAIDWEDDPDIPGFRQKILSFNEATKAVVRLWFIPPDWGADIFDGKPDRHYHKSVVERGFHLYGDFPHWEFSNVADMKGDLHIFNRGIFMNRPPGSLHGLLPEPRSKAGAVIVYWVTGPGASIKDPEFEKETVTVPFDKDVKVELNKFNPCTIVQTEDMDWEPHPEADGWKIKHLAEPDYGADSVDLVHIPTDWQPPDRWTYNVVTESLTPWLYIVNGDLNVTVGSEEIKLRQDDFLAWPAELPVILPNAPVTDVGCIALCSGHSLTAAKA
ncbi:MAG: hypothetical protein ACJZ9F_05980 [Rhodospirillaceae bacterium]